VIVSILFWEEEEPWNTFGRPFCITLLISVFLPDTILVLVHYLILLHCITNHGYIVRSSH
jgi:hypothetical protein